MTETVKTEMWPQRGMAQKALILKEVGLREEVEENRMQASRHRYPEKDHEGTGVTSYH